MEPSTSIVSKFTNMRKRFRHHKSLKKSIITTEALQVLQPYADRVADNQYISMTTASTLRDIFPSVNPASDDSLPKSRKTTQKIAPRLYSHFLSHINSVKGYIKVDANVASSWLLPFAIYGRKFIASLDTTTHAITDPIDWIQIKTRLKRYSHH